MVFSSDTLITLLQALQLAALAPCLFVILFLLFTSRQYKLVIVPCLYFAALASSFMLPLLTTWPHVLLHGDGASWLQGVLILIQSLLPALSFLLIIQFATGAVPALFYWLILALPIIGGSGVVYASLLTDQLCLSNIRCIPASAVEGLYSTFSNALIFLLLVVRFTRTRNKDGSLAAEATNRYWLIVALICLNLLVMGIELLKIAGSIHAADAMFAITMLRMTFIYLVLTLLFRLFDRVHHSKTDIQDTSLRIPEEQANKDNELNDKDHEAIVDFEKLMTEQRLYREMGCNRESLAQELSISENMLSRIINQHYKLRLTDVINQYRVKEAQMLLVTNPDQAITDIAFEVGFNSIPSFNRVFKDGCGVSPSEYRNNHVKVVKQQRYTNTK